MCIKCWFCEKMRKQQWFWFFVVFWSHEKWGHLHSVLILYFFYTMYRTCSNCVHNFFRQNAINDICGDKNSTLDPIDLPWLTSNMSIHQFIHNFSLKFWSPLQNFESFRNYVGHLLAIFLPRPSSRQLSAFSFYALHNKILTNFYYFYSSTSISS